MMYITVIIMQFYLDHLKKRGGAWNIHFAVENKLIYKITDINKRQEKNLSFEE
jgi:hypothetical protein